MSTYKELFGKYVQSLATDPTTAVAEGQIWYNTTSNTFRTILGTGAWSSGGSLNTINSALAGAGTQNDMLVATGTSPANPGISTNAEVYNGTSWTAITPTPTATSQAASTGTVTTAANIVGGGSGAAPKFNITQHWNGSGWSAGGTLATARANMRGTGPDAAGIVLGGQAPTGSSAAEKYNGTSWSSAGNLAAANFGGSMAGTSTAAIGFGGYYDLRPSGGSEAQTANTFSYDGSTWTIVNSMANVRNYGQGAGSQGSAIVGGTNSAPNSTLAEQWDGTSWTAAAVMGIGRWSGASAGTSGAAATVVAGLSGGSYVGTSEEFTFTTTIPVAAGWASGGNLVNTRDSMMTAAQAPQPAAFIFGGHNNSGTLTFSESYDGTCWTGTNALPVSKQLGGGAGTQTAALCFGGQTAPPAVTRATTESWDGSNWTAVAAPGGTLATGRFNGGSAGVQGAALMFGGGPPTTATSEEWNGSTWSPGGSLSRGTTGADNVCGAGIQTSALAMGGTAPSFVYDTTEEYNGTSWSGGGGMNTARRRAAAAASTVDAGLCFGGLASPGSGQTAAAELYDGTSWTNTASMGTARYYLGGSGATQGDGFAMGGLLTGTAASFTDKTEEYTAAGTALNYKTLTTS